MLWSWVTNNWVTVWYSGYVADIIFQLFSIFHWNTLHCGWLLVNQFNWLSFMNYQCNQPCLTRLSLPQQAAAWWPVIWGSAYNWDKTSRHATMDQNLVEIRPLGEFIFSQLWHIVVYSQEKLNRRWSVAYTWINANWQRYHVSKSEIKTEIDISSQFHSTWVMTFRSTLFIKTSQF